VISDLHALDVTTDRLDNPGTFVAEDDGAERIRDEFVAWNEIGMTQAGGLDPDKDLVGAKVIELDRLQGVVGIVSAEDRGDS
jgi:hypothetical protein